MNWIMLALGLTIFLLVFKNIKHEIFRRSLKIVAILFFVFLFLTVLSHYVELDSFFDQENPITITGVAVIDSLRGNIKEGDIVDKGDFEVILDKGRDVTKTSKKWFKKVS